MLFKLRTYFLRQIVSSRYFWKLRHLFQPSWINDYSENSNKFLEKLVRDNNIQSILDFGCASGATLFQLKQNNDSLKVYGIDINRHAIKYCLSRFSDNFKGGYSFSTKLNKKEIYEFLSDNELNSFDLIIFDRVLYSLDQKEINKILQLIPKITEQVFIDDFFNSNGNNYLGYKHRDWEKILYEIGFGLELNISTTHSHVVNANARTMIYKKIG